MSFDSEIAGTTYTVFYCAAVCSFCSLRWMCPGHNFTQCLCLPGHCADSSGICSLSTKEAGPSQAAFARFIEVWPATCEGLDYQCNAVHV